jgi:adenine specific DNA methylase Mod
MKKEKEESPLKVARKKTREAIEVRLAKHLRNITTEIGKEAIDIEKEAKKLAKKITKGLKKADAEKPVKENKTAEKPASKSPVSNAKKPVAKAAPAKTTAPKAAPAVKPKK